MDNYSKFLETIKLVASSPDVQLSIIPKQACRPDEIAFCLEEIMPLLDGFLEKNVITKEVASVIRNIDQIFLSFCKEDWTETSLIFSEKWNRVRGLALEALEMMGEKAEIPDLFWICDIF